MCAIQPSRRPKPNFSPPNAAVSGEICLPPLLKCRAKAPPASVPPFGGRGGSPATMLPERPDAPGDLAPGPDLAMADLTCRRNPVSQDTPAKGSGTG